MMGHMVETKVKADDLFAFTFKIVISPKLSVAIELRSRAQLEES